MKELKKEFEEIKEIEPRVMHGYQKPGVLCYIVKSQVKIHPLRILLCCIHNFPTMKVETFNLIEFNYENFVD